jgi:hypothetical protein
VSAASKPWTSGEPGLLDALEVNPLDRIDEIGFGLIVMNRSGEVIGYNAFESERSGLLAEQLDYVFTFRMAPTPVRLRLLARAGSLRQYLAVRFR